MTKIFRKLETSVNIYFTYIGKFASELFQIYRTLHAFDFKWLIFVPAGININSYREDISLCVSRTCALSHVIKLFISCTKGYDGITKGFRTLPNRWTRHERVMCVMFRDALDRPSVT